MGRKKMLWYPGAIYHVMARGNRKNDIFIDYEDRIVYFSILKSTLEKHCAILYCYCLMTNHVHLQIETQQVEISKIMQILNQSYAKYFNNKYNFVGHLFQGRYNWEIIQDDNYLVEVSRYIHLNPVRANIIRKPQDYNWSSYSMIIGYKKENIINSYKILSYFDNIDMYNGRKRYKNFVESLL